MHQESTLEPVNGGETAGVLVRPPLLFLTALLLGFAADHLVRPFTLPGDGPVHYVIAPALIVLGLGIAILGIRNFSGAGTPVPTNLPVWALVTSGIHSRTRNPIYLGMFLLYGGIGLLTRSPWTLLLLVPVAVTMRYGVVAREEAYLERRFGEEYRAYKARVRRWL